MSVLAISEIIPEIKTIVDKWREIIKHNGFEGIYLISMQNFEENNPYTMGFDAAVEFAPRVSKNIITKQKMISREEAIETNASFITMDQILKKLTYRPKSSFPRIKCVCPSWNNTPRRGKTGSRIILDSSVSKFAEFYKRAIKETIANDFPADGLLFINAWNEWGEGTHLEPDKKHGYQLLETIKGIMEKTITRLKNDKL